MGKKRAKVVSGKVVGQQGSAPTNYMLLWRSVFPFRAFQPRWLNEQHTQVALKKEQASSLIHRSVGFLPFLWSCSMLILSHPTATSPLEFVQRGVRRIRQACASFNGRSAGCLSYCDDASYGGRVVLLLNFPVRMRIIQSAQLLIQTPVS